MGLEHFRQHGRSSMDNGLERNETGNRETGSSQKSLAMIETAKVIRLDVSQAVAMMWKGQI